MQYYTSLQIFSQIIFIYWEKIMHNTEEIKNVSLGKDDIKIYNIKNTEFLMMLI